MARSPNDIVMGKDGLKPSTSGPSSSRNVVDLNDDEAFLAPGTEEEQLLVNKFLDGEMNFSDYFGTLENFDDEIDQESGDTKQEITGTISGLEIDSPQKLSSSKSSRPRKSRKLPPALSGLMGEANLRYARGDKETAVKICLEIIRQVPTASEPFLTLASIFEEMGDQEKFLQMSLVAAHLSSTDAYEWIHLGEISEKLGHFRQAANCYTKSLNLDVMNFELHQRRATLLEKFGDRKTPLFGYLRFLSNLKPDNGEQVLTMAKQIAELCHKENDIAKASRALGIAFDKCPNLITDEFTNLQLELLIQLKDFMGCLELMTKFCHLEISRVNDNLVDCSVPPGTPIDIVAKLIIVLVHLKSDVFSRLLKLVTDVNPTEAGDLYLDIIDSLIEEEYFIEADRLYGALVSCPSYSLPAVWLKYAENLKALNRIDDAVRAYYKVVEQAPQHAEARMTLGTLLMRLGRNDEAISAVTQNVEYDYLDVGLLYERCLLLMKYPERANELIVVGQILFSRHCLQIRNRDEISAISCIQRFDKKRAAIRQVRKTRKEPEEDTDTPLFREENHCPTRPEEWELFKYICNVCYKTKAYPAFQRLTFTAQLSNVFAPFKYELDALSIIAAHLNKDTHNAYNIIRILVQKEPGNNRLWHLLNLIISKSDNSRHHRFIMRQLARNSTQPALTLLHGNNCLVSGTYKYALHEYSSAYVKEPQALSALLLGLTYLQMAGQKFTSKKHQLVVQALAHLSTYGRLRGIGGEQEVHYNLGRGFHHLGLYAQAVYHYNRVLELRGGRLAASNPGVFDLSKEAAYNLHLIYIQSESYDMAKMYIEKYLVV